MREKKIIEKILNNIFMVKGGCRQVVKYNNFVLFYLETLS